MKGLIRLSFAKLIDASSQKPWDKTVFEETYQEFFMQAQLYNPQNQYQTFQELPDNVPNADQLHYLTSRVALGYLKQLNQLIPDVVNMGKLTRIAQDLLVSTLVGSTIRIRLRQPPTVRSRAFLCLCSRTLLKWPTDFSTKKMVWHYATHRMTCWSLKPRRTMPSCF